MNVRVAFLGWGSLLWEPSDFDNWREPWAYDGPTLKIEFSRISKTREGALTLVIDPLNGTSNRVAWCLSRRPTERDAIGDLQRREGTRDEIGILGRDARKCHDADSDVSIREWSVGRSLDAVIWTDLRSNFRDKTGNPFTVEAAMAYLCAMQGNSRERAYEYIRRAPAFVVTPLRSAFERELG